MGLTKEVRDFFINRINKILDEKQAELLKGVDEEALKNEATLRLSQELRIGTLYYEIKDLNEEAKRIEKEKERLCSLLDGEMDKAGFPSRYWKNATVNFEVEASKKFYDGLFKEQYPETSEALKKLDEIKSNVHASVLLATTEPKLVATLNKLLNSYGGDISELLDLIPKE